MVKLAHNAGTELIVMAPKKRPLALCAQPSHQQDPEDPDTPELDRQIIGAAVRLQIPLADMSVTQLRELAKAMQKTWAQVEAITLRDATVQAKDFSRERRHVMCEARALLLRISSRYLPKGKGGRPRNL